MTVPTARIGRKPWTRSTTAGIVAFFRRGTTVLSVAARNGGLRKRFRQPVTLPRALPDFARLEGIGGNHSGRLSRRIGQVLVEKCCSEWFDSRRLHQFFSALGQVSADAATSTAARPGR